MALTKEEFKKALGHWASGVTVVTYSDNGIYNGLTVSSFSSLSIDPFLILFSVQKDSPGHDKIDLLKKFAVNVLSSGQEKISNDFAKSDSDRNTIVREVGYTLQFSNSPLLNNSLCHLDCTLENMYDGGDHSIFIGRVHYAFTDESKRPLIYFNRKYYNL